MAFTAFSSFAFTAKPNKEKEQSYMKKNPAECAAIAWETGNNICEGLANGCSDEELYMHTDIAYSMCMFY